MTSLQYCTGNFRPSNSSMDQQDSPIPIASSSNGRVSGKPWKTRKTPTMCVLHTMSMSVIPTGYSPVGHTCSRLSNRETSTIGWRKPAKRRLLKNCKRCLRKKNRLKFNGETFRAPVSHSFYTVSTSHRRREVTLERRKAAEERKRAEELKAQVRVEPMLIHPVSHCPARR